MPLLSLLIIVLQYFQAGFSQNKQVKIGDYACGGVVFWLDPSGQHGLVCSKEDLIRETFWFDTVALKNKYPDEFVNRAIEVCEEYSVIDNGVIYDDWHLPAKDEVYTLCEKQKLIEKTALQHSGSGFTINNELSPTEFCNSPAWDQVFNYGYSNYDYPNSKFNVRAVREF